MPLRSRGHGASVLPLLQRRQRTGGDAVGECFTVVGMGERLRRHLHLEELAERSPALGHVPDEQALGRNGRPDGILWRVIAAIIVAGVSPAPPAKVPRSIQNMRSISLR